MTDFNLKDFVPSSKAKLFVESSKEEGEELTEMVNGLHTAFEAELTEAQKARYNVIIDAMDLRMEIISMISYVTGKDLSYAETHAIFKKKNKKEKKK